MVKPRPCPGAAGLGCGRGAGPAGATPCGTACPKAAPAGPAGTWSPSRRDKGADLNGLLDATARAGGRPSPAEPPEGGSIPRVKGGRIRVLAIGPARARPGVRPQAACRHPSRRGGLLPAESPTPEPAPACNLPPSLCRDEPLMRGGPRRRSRERKSKRERERERETERERERSRPFRCEYLSLAGTSTVRGGARTLQPSHT